MRDATKKEWDLIVCEEVYIYGAAKTAETLYLFLKKSGYTSVVKGFLVTDMVNNPNGLCGLPVKDIHSFERKEAHILVPHMGIYKEQISGLLEMLGFKNVYLIAHLITRTRLEEKKILLEDSQNDAESEREENVTNSKENKLKQEILSILREEMPDFGGTLPYQSLELIGLHGMRPTEERIREYQLRDILRAEDDVLDIGCNLGFFDISIASLVHSVTGIEYDASLVRVADLVKNHLKIKNCTFYNADFNQWYKNQTATYNVIFSFAMHHWLNIPAQEYVTILNNLLRSHGYIGFESHMYGTDLEFTQCYEAFQRIGYHVVCDKKINDSGLQDRQYVLLQK